MPAQTFVDERSIVASFGAFHLTAEQLQNLIVEAGGQHLTRRDDFDFVFFRGGPSFAASAKGGHR